MSKARMDYTKKIQFAEQWLEKAKREFEQGSPVQAGSHVMLAIAEMETLKRNIFQDSEAEEVPAVKARPSRLDLRVAFALMLFLAALMLFTLASRQSETQTIQPSTGIAGDTTDTYMNREYRFSPYLDGVMENIDLPDVAVLEKPASDSEPATVDKPSESAARPVTSETSRVRQPIASSGKVEQPVKEEIAVAEAPVAPPAAVSSEDRIFPVNILRETIYVANESLKDD